MFHDRRAYFTRLRPVLSLADSVVVENTTAAQTVRSFAALVVAALHVLPEDDHLWTELDRTRRTDSALAGVA